MTVVFDREPYGLRLLRRAATNDYSANLLSSEAADVVAEIERLRVEVEAANAEAATMRAWAEEAAAAENENAEDARRERVAVVAFLTGENDARCRFISDHVAMRIERGEHRREETE